MVFMRFHIEMTQHFRHSVSNHPQLGCLFNKWFRLSPRNHPSSVLSELCKVIQRLPMDSPRNAPVPLAGDATALVRRTKKLTDTQQDRRDGLLEHLRRYYFACVAYQLRIDGAWVTHMRRIWRMNGDRVYLIFDLVWGRSESERGLTSRFPSCTPNNMAEAGSKDAEGLSNRRLEYVPYFTFTYVEHYIKEKSSSSGKNHLDKGVKYFMEGFIHQIKGKYPVDFISVCSSSCKQNHATKSKLMWSPYMLYNLPAWCLWSMSSCFQGAR